MDGRWCLLSLSLSISLSLSLSVTVRRILKERPRFPSFITPPAKAIVLSLMEADITRRLGCMAGGVNDLHEHPW